MNSVNESECVEVLLKNSTWDECREKMSRIASGDNAYFDFLNTETKNSWRFNKNGDEILC